MISINMCSLTQSEYSQSTKVKVKVICNLDLNMIIHMFEANFICYQYITDQEKEYISSCCNISWKFHPQKEESNKNECTHLLMKYCKKSNQNISVTYNFYFSLDKYGCNALPMPWSIHFYLLSQKP